MKFHPLLKRKNCSIIHHELVINFFSIIIDALDMIESTIYSIGHGTKSIEDFILQLQSFQIQFLIDVRTTPYSRYNPQYNRENIENLLSKVYFLRR